MWNQAFKSSTVADFWFWTHISYWVYWCDTKTRFHWTLTFATTRYVVSAVPHELKQECVQSIMAGWVYLSDGLNFGYQSLRASGVQTCNPQFTLSIIHKDLTIKSSGDFWEGFRRSSVVRRACQFFLTRNQMRWQIILSVFVLTVQRCFLVHLS